MSEKNRISRKSFFELQEQLLRQWKNSLPAPRSRTFKVWRSFIDPLYQEMMKSTEAGFRAYIKLMVHSVAIIKD